MKIDCPCFIFSWYGTLLSNILTRMVLLQGYTFYLNNGKGGYNHTDRYHILQEETIHIKETESLLTVMFDVDLKLMICSWMIPDEVIVLFKVIRIQCQFLFF